MVEVSDFRREAVLTLKLFERVRTRRPLTEFRQAGANACLVSKKAASPAAPAGRLLRKSRLFGLWSFMGSFLFHRSAPDSPLLDGGCPERVATSDRGAKALLERLSRRWPV